MKAGLIIFVRNPILGQVKTRLARTIGDDNALVIYRHLLEHTLAVTRELPCDKFVFYADTINKGDLWPNDRYKKHLQSGNNLGERMQNAFSILFVTGYEKLIIIGSDCYELTSEIIEAGFSHLEGRDVVAGPSLDGGYYLLGIKKLIPSFFSGKTWSTSTVLADTLADCRTLNLAYSLLPVLKDIDEEEDIPGSLKNIYE